MTGWVSLKSYFAVPLMRAFELGPVNLIFLKKESLTTSNVSTSFDIAFVGNRVAVTSQRYQPVGGH